MGMIDQVCREGAPVLFTTSHRVVETGDPASVDAAIGRWKEMTGRGGEGMVVKPLP